MIHQPIDAPFIRSIRRQDDPEVAVIIRRVMTEFGAVGCDFPIVDPEIDAMSAAYRTPRSAFFVVEQGGRIRGCGGMGPLAGGDPDICELRKMYFLPELRGAGLGTALLEHILGAARRAGYRTCYLETLDRMEQARSLYRAHGFEPVDTPLGDTGHPGCNFWMAKAL